MTKTNYIALAFAGITAFGAAQTASAETQKFEKDGYTYVYSTREVGKSTLIDGRFYPGARPFALRVRNNRVEGTVEGHSIAFPLSRVDKADTLASAR